MESEGALPPSLSGLTGDSWHIWHMDHSEQLHMLVVVLLDGRVALCRTSEHGLSYPEDIKLVRAAGSFPCLALCPRLSSSLLAPQPPSHVPHPLPSHFSGFRHPPFAMHSFLPLCLLPAARLPSSAVVSAPSLSSSSSA